MTNVSKSRYLVFGSYVLLCLFSFMFLQKGHSLGAVPAEGSLKLYPHVYDHMPPVSSPHTMIDGTEVVVAFMKSKKYTCFPVTVENGDPLIYSQGRGQVKGKQLEIDGEDFPTLAETGLHSEIELDQTKTITGRSAGMITEIGRPERSSGAGFMAQNEDIISVLVGDNRLVSRMGLTHPQTAKALFHVWNLVFFPYQEIEFLVYNGKKIFLEIRGSKGWQDSIFNDEIEGQYTLKIWRELDPGEKEFINKTYPDLDDEPLARLIENLSHIDTGEMAFYYIMRYGFYEGHTDFRADPIACAFVFGLRSLKDIDKALDGDFYKALNEHFTRESFFGGMKNE